MLTNEQITECADLLIARTTALIQANPPAKDTPVTADEAVYAATFGIKLVANFFCNMNDIAATARANDPHRTMDAPERQQG